MASLRVFSLYGLTIFILSQVPKSPTYAAMPCYDEFKKPKICTPAFENVAFGKLVEATNTCGLTADVEFCWINAHGGGNPKNCSLCSEDSSRGRKFSTSGITDAHHEDKATWWQSETMFEGIHTKTVNLTLHLGKAFDVTYMMLRFVTPRPESFAIFKRTAEHEPWVPFQFFSASCQRTYGLPDRRIVTNVTAAICTSKHSDISPLSGGRVVFSSLEGRHHLARLGVSEDWVTATDIRIVLTKPNTFGDEVLGEPKVLKSYFYAISDLQIGARCRCNGHSNECRKENGGRLECVCEHFTTGTDCQECLPFYNDKPWRKATISDAFPCQACNCSGMSEECVYDPQLDRQTGHGGRCLNCRHNTVGPHCELCKENHIRVSGKCLDCRCNVAGSASPQCDDNGQCPCKKGIEGLKCDRCSPGFFGNVESGCKPCNCVVAGSLNNDPKCDSTTGKCACKENVDGHRCNRCKPAFFGLSEEDPFGCEPCFCHGHSTVCSSASGYYAQRVMSTFKTGREGWTAVTMSDEQIETKFDALSEKVCVSSGGNSEGVYFSAPRRYLGDQSFSYNQFLRFDMNIGAGIAQPSDADVVLEGSDQTVTIPITGQSNPTPGAAAKSFAFRLHEHPEYRWKPTIKSADFVALLSNLTALKIRATYNLRGVGFLDNVELMSASKQFGGDPAMWIESCSCPEGYSGHSCETCAQGYTRNPSEKGSSGQCVPCQCNSHSDHCDVDNGRCINCGDNTEGKHCEKCIDGFYGNSTFGTKGDCVLCPCPSGNSCIPMPNGDVICVDVEEVKKMKEKILMLEGKTENATEKYEREKTNKDFQIQQLEDKVDRLTVKFNQLSSANEALQRKVRTLEKKSKDVIKTFKKVFGIRV